MTKQKSGRGGLFPQPLDFKLSRIYQRGKTITPVDSQSTTFTQRLCGHGRETVRHVVELDGGITYLCRSCWQQTCATEVRAAHVAVWNNLWKVRPRLIRAGGAIGALAGRIVDHLLARALVAAYRGKRHWPFITLARIVARIAERGAAV